MFIWHLMIYKQNFDQKAIDDFFKNIYKQRDHSGLHFKKMTVDGHSKQIVLATLWFEPENELSDETLIQIVKFIYTQLLAGLQFELPTYARILRESLATLGIEMAQITKQEYNLNFWGVPKKTT